MIDEKYMLQALKLARLGGRAVAPNPMVGAVIVKNGKVIGKGYHKKFGGPHAEVNAIKSVKNKDDLKGATIYVTLEPCRHFGKTPPCYDLIRHVGIIKVVCGSTDPFRGKFQIPNSKLQTNPKSQITFLTGPVAQQCKELNKFFFTWVTEKRPFITVKIAMSADGFVAGENGQPVHFTTKKQDKEVHQLRADHQAIMVGINTVLNDDPRLNVRLVKGKDPLRIILDSRLRTPKNAKVLRDGNFLVVASLGAQTIARFQDGLAQSDIWISPTKKRVSLKKLFAYLAEQKIGSVLVEPGPTLYRSLKQQGLVDELIVYKSKKKLKKGLKIDI